MQTHLKQTEEEKQFCRELFTAMHEDVARLADPAKLIYPYTFEEANERLETAYYHESRDRNAYCAQAIDNEINASCYETYRYSLEHAAMAVVQQYGFNRVNAVLAHNLQTHESDGRYCTAPMWNCNRAGRRDRFAYPAIFILRKCKKFLTLNLRTSIFKM